MNYLFFYMRQLQNFRDSGKSMILDGHCKSWLASSLCSDEDILQRVAESEQMQGLRTHEEAPGELRSAEQVSKANRARRAKERFYTAKSFATGSYYSKNE